MTNRLELNWNLDGFIDEQRYYCSETPFNEATKPTPLTVLANDVRTYIDTSVQIGKPHYFAISSVKNGLEKLSPINVLHLETDPNYSKLACALVMNTTTVTDVTGRSTFANNGRAALDNVYKLASKPTLKFSSASNFFDVYSNLSFGTGDFCIRCWVRLDSYPGGGGNNDMSIVDLQNGFFLYCHNTTGELRMWDGTASVGLNGGSAGILPLNTWSFIEASRTAGVFRLFLNGKMLGSVNYTRNLSSVSYARVGGSTYMNTTRFMRGNIARLSIYRGWGGHTSDYIPPIEPEYLHYI